LSFVLCVTSVTSLLYCCTAATGLKPNCRLTNIYIPNIRGEFIKHISTRSPVSLSSSSAMTDGVHIARTHIPILHNYVKLACFGENVCFRLQVPRETKAVDDGAALLTDLMYIPGYCLASTLSVQLTPMVSTQHPERVPRIIIRLSPSGQWGRVVCLEPTFRRNVSPPSSD
jgi:hypothetical protein